MRIHRQRSPGRFSPLLKILLSLVLITGISFCLAWVWHSTEQTVPAEIAAESLDEEVTSPPETEPATQPASAAEETPLSEETGGDDAQTTPAGRVVFDGAVPESAAVDNSYFDDAIFLGDSISTGIPLYHVADNAAVVAMTGINTENINHKLCIDIGEEERVTVLDAAKLHGDRKKVYILLGGNGLGYDKSTFIEGYKTFLDSVKRQYPGAVIYLQSMTPVVEGYVNEFDPELDNDKIDEYNLEIMALARRENVYYLDIASALKNENGALPDEASPMDGMHFIPEYYIKWFDYLKTHTVEVSR